MPRPPLDPELVELLASPAGATGSPGQFGNPAIPTPPGMEDAMAPPGIPGEEGMAPGMGEQPGPGDPVLAEILKLLKPNPLDRKHGKAPGVGGEGVIY